MRLISFFLFFLMLSAICPADELYGKVVWIYNGDTFKLKTDNGIFKVKLYGVDAPEDGQTFAPQSKQKLTELIDGKSVSVTQTGIDSHTRVVGIVSNNGECINQKMLEEGMGWWARHLAPKSPMFQRAEETAREAKKGLWQETDPIAPWDWKAANKQAKKASQ